MTLRKDLKERREFSGDCMGKPELFIDKNRKLLVLKTTFTSKKKYTETEFDILLKSID